MTDLLTQWREHRKQCNREDDSERLGDLMAAEIEALRGEVLDERGNAEAARYRVSVYEKMMIAADEMKRLIEGDTDYGTSHETEWDVDANAAISAYVNEKEKLK